MKDVHMNKGLQTATFPSYCAFSFLKFKCPGT